MVSGNTWRYAGHTPEKRRTWFNTRVDYWPACRKFGRRKKMIVRTWIFGDYNDWGKIHFLSQAEEYELNFRCVAHLY